MAAQMRERLYLVDFVFVPQVYLSGFVCFGYLCMILYSSTAQTRDQHADIAQAVFFARGVLEARRD